MPLPYDQSNPYFMCIRDGHTKKFKGGMKVHAKTLDRLNREGYGVYFCAADMGASDKKTKSNVLGTWTLWADKDDGALDDGFEPAPNITVQTSEDKYQYYWKMNSPIKDIDKIEEMLGRVIAKTGADPKCRDACRLMRVPGFANQKNGYDVKIVSDDGGCYTLTELEEGFPVSSPDLPNPSDTPKTGFSMGIAVRDILTGDDIHGSRAGISMHLANTGMRESTCLELVEALIDSGYEIGNIEVSRYKERKANNKQVVNSAYLKIHGELPEYEFDDIETGLLYTIIPPLPLCGLKTIVDDIMSNMYHPVYEVAVPLAMHLVGMFGSGGYHLDGVTGTKRRAICMQSGSGKDVVTSYITACIRELADARAENFKGANSFTPRTVHAELRHFRCRSYIVSEAGIVGQSETGDVANMRAYMLQALAAKADRPLSIRATVADIKAAKEENMTMDVHGTVVNVIAESTVETYAKMMQLSHSDVTGMMGREELIFPKPDFDYAKSNRKGFTGVGEPAMDILQPLAQRFLDHPSTSGGIVSTPGKTFANVDTSAVDELLDADHRRCCELKNKHLDSRQAISTQYSRLHEKVKCTALVLALADSPYDDPVILPEHIEWAIKYHRALITTVTAHLSGSGALATPMEGCIDTLEKAVVNWPIKAYDKKLTLNVPKRIVQRAWLSKVLDKSNCRPFRDLTDTIYFGKGVDARRAVLNEAIDKGLIVKTVYEKKDAFILPKRG